MKLSINVIIGLLLCIFFSLAVPKAWASYIPDIDGYVRVAGTNAAVAGVWVQMRDNGECGEYQYRYAKTNSNGHYVFTGWTQGGPTAVGEGVPIDTNLDKTNDAIQYPTEDLCDPTDSPGSDFGCGRDPFRVTAIRPFNWNGTFDIIGPSSSPCYYCIDNSTIAPDVPTIFWHPNVVPTLTPTRTPSPTKLPTPILTPTLSPTAGPSPTPSPTGLLSPTPTPTPIVNTIRGSIFVDTNQNGVQDISETLYSTSIQVKLVNVVTLAASYTSTSTGQYSFNNVVPDSYRVRLIAPAGISVTTTNPVPVTMVSGTIVVNFGISPGNLIVGNVFIDANNDRLKDSSEYNYNGSITITSTSGVVTTNTTGKYSVSNLPDGTYTVSFTSLPASYRMTYPLNGPPPSFTVTVGPSCAVDGTTGGQCNINGDVVNLNFAISESIPWVQHSGLDARYDRGFTSYIPSSPACSGTYGMLPGAATNSGIIFTGNQIPDFGKGTASSSNWIVGGATYPEVYKPSKTALVTSYNSLLTTVQKSTIPIVDIQTVPGCNNLTNCTLPVSLKTYGSIFQASGDLTLNSYSFIINENFIFLINGNLTINGSIIVNERCFHCCTKYNYK
jgi:hypothetical protein